MYSVSARGQDGVEVDAVNWVTALGKGLTEMKVETPPRLAAEELPNGTVIARDISTGMSFIVVSMGEEEEDLIEPLPSIDEALALGDGDESMDEITAELEELPLDALTELAPEEAELVAIDQAETLLVACRRALTIARERIPAESGAVILEEKGKLRFLAVAGPFARRLIGVRLPAGTGVAGFAMKKRRTVVLKEAQKDARHCGEVDALTGYQTREICVVPLCAGDRVLGVIELMNLPQGRRFTDEEIGRLKSVADALTARLVS